VNRSLIGSCSFNGEGCKVSEFQPVIAADCLIDTEGLGVHIPDMVSLRALPMAFAICFVAFAVNYAQTNDDTRWAIRNAETVDGSHFPSGKPQTQCGPLEYFSGKPNLFAMNFRYKDEPSESVKSTYVGEVNGAVIYTIIHRNRYTFTGDLVPSYIKMIVVERKPGEFCAIYKDNQQDAPMELVEPALLDEVDSQTVLESDDAVSGNGRYHLQAYWTFDEIGPIFLDTAILEEALGKLLPPSLHAGRGTYFDIQTLTLKGPVARDPAACCADAGKFAIKFVIRSHQLEVLSQQFDRTP
jgi:hypothetical protein